ncbi:MAG TPA: hypothetical protein VHY08_07195, partial [Bacillota bacterium]|nr:hypothetical protein [Bacillota bacterium]
DIKYKGMTIAGGGAIAVILYLLLHYYGAGQNITHGRISGKFSANTMILVEDRDELLGAFRGERLKHYEFVIEGKELELSNLTVSITDQNLMVDEILTVNQKYVKPYLQKGKWIEWEFNEKTKSLIDKNTKKVVSDPDLGANWVSGWMRGMGNGLPSNLCYAASAPQADPDYEGLFEGLLSDNLRVRRDSRVELIKRGFAATQPILAKYRSDSANYRLKSNLLYVLVAISEDVAKGSNSKSNLAKMKSLLTEADLRLFIQNVLEVDKSGNQSGNQLNSVNQYATQFLCILADARALTPVLAELDNPQLSGEGEYNLVLIAKRIIAELPQGEKTKANEQLKELRKNLQPKALKLLES